MTDAEITEVWAQRRLLAELRGIRPRRARKMRLDNPYLPDDALDLMYSLRNQTG